MATRELRKVHFGRNDGGAEFTGGTVPTCDVTSFPEMPNSYFHNFLKYRAWELRSYQVIERFEFALFLRLALLAWLLPAISVDLARAEEAAPPALARAAQQAYRALKERDLDEFHALCTSDQIFHMAIRKAVWTRIEDQSIRRPTDEGVTHLLDDLAHYGWEERDMEFETGDPQNLAKWKEAVARFAKEIDKTMHGAGAALQQKDIWGERQLGPSAEGKLASNYFWYLYFRQENGQWKIWKLELAIH